MMNEDNIHTIRQELNAGLQLAKCKKCGCMKDTLDNLAVLLSSINTDESYVLEQEIEMWAGIMELVEYPCLGCDHCYPALAQNAFFFAFPSVGQEPILSCDFQVNNEGWPPVVGEYFVGKKSASVAVSTLASVHLAEDLARRQPHGLAIVGKTETENIGIDKVIKNIITNPSIQYLLIVGNDPSGHESGKTLLCLSQSGVDAERHVIGAPGKRPVLRNVSKVEIETFRKQVQVINMIGCHDALEICTHIEEFSRAVEAASVFDEAIGKSSPISITTAPTLLAPEPGDVVRMDQSGYFVIVPLTDKGIINVEHYAYDNTLLRVIEGTNARALYSIIVSNGWVSELSHAAYLGKELTKAELSITFGFKYLQDKA